MQKKISLEPMTSRLPSILPAYKDNKLYFFDDKALRDRKFIYPSNYGMVPINIVLNVSGNGDLSGICDFSFANGNHCYAESDNETYSKFGNFTISFETLSKWYHFFKEYYHLLNDYGHCNRNYSSATEYYEYESGNKYARQMIYGTDKQTYIDLDNEFHSKGGMVKMANGEAVDDCFYKWICENIVPTYCISIDYQDYWKRKYLYYPDVIKWLAWFNERLDYEQYYIEPQKDSKGNIIELESWDCKSSDNCCECEEYFNRGGKRERDNMLKWYKDIQKNILTSVTTACTDPTIIFPVELQTSIDDLGQFSIFSKEYEAGTDYRTIKTETVNNNTIIHFSDGNTNSGTVVSFNGEPLILTQGQGFCYDPYLMERLYNGNDWENYTDKFMMENKDLFVTSAITYYTFDENDEIKTSNASSIEDASNELAEKLVKKYPLIKSENGWVYINEILYPIETSEYATVEIKNSEKVLTYFVHRDEYTETPYVEINGKRIYAEFYPYKGDGVYYFTMFKSDYTAPLLECGTEGFNINEYKHFPRRKGNDVIRYINYSGVVYKLNDTNRLVIDGEYHDVVTAYAVNDEHQTMYVVNGNVYYADENNDGIGDMVDNCSVRGDFIVSGTTDQPQIFSATEITGRTISRLYDLRSTLLMMDDIGNKIEGLRILNKGSVQNSTYNFQPKQGTILEPIYQVGNTANISRMRITETSETDNITELYVVGDIIDDMEFYFKDIYGNKVFETAVSCKREKISSLSAINRSIIAMKANNDTIFEDDISCDITYYIGATLRREQDKGFELASTYGDYNNGVEYKETVHFVKDGREYYTKKKPKVILPSRKKEPDSHSVSYPIFIYVLRQDMEDIDSSTYETRYSAALADFKCEINLITENDGSLTTTFSKYEDMDTYNGIKAYPIFREEYSLGISSMENIDSDIYIERGINAAFEKHIKLGEVVSLEALEQYGNGYFKIIES